MAASSTARRRSEVISLLSDDEDEDEVQVLPGPDHRPENVAPEPPNLLADAAENFNLLNDFMNFGGDLPGAFPGLDEPIQQPVPSPPPPPSPANNPNEELDGEYLMIDGERVFIPNSPGAAAQPTMTPQGLNDFDQEAFHATAESFTADACLQHVLAVLPDVSHEHVHQLYSEIESSVPGPQRIEHIVNKLLSAETYPKQDKGKQKKRKREDEEEEAERKRWEGADREAEPNHLKGIITSMLKAEFPEATTNMIADQFRAHRHLYQTYIALAKSKDGNDSTGWRGRPPKGRLADADTIAANSGFDALSDELKAARKEVGRIRAERRAEDAKKAAEQENLQRAIEAGETAECQACFEELPMNRQIHCNGDTAHFTCFECAETYIKSEVGDARCRVLCTAGCGSGFAHAQLHLLSDKKLLEKLEQLQQEKDIREAGLDDLEECPFCDYKAILPPVEEDFEFRCMNPECEKVSCRRCKSMSHIPQSCEEYAKDNKLNTRHKIEEAMTAALIRSCNKCKKQFIKEYGCNKMTCTSCNSLQCYVCGESLKSYDHFDQGPGYGRGGAANPGQKKKCPLYDNVEERHEREVKEAEAAARAQAMAENPDVSEQDLEIKVSDAVQQSTRRRIQAGAVPGGAHPDYAGLFAQMPRAHQGLWHGADDEEAFDDGLFDVFGEADFDFRPRRRDPAGARVARLANALGEDRNRADPLADPRRHRHHAIPQAPANPAPGHLGGLAARVQGFIPVFGLGLGRQAAAPPAPAEPNRFDQPAAQPAVQPAGRPLGAGGLFDRFQQHFGNFGADADRNPFNGIAGPGLLGRPADAAQQQAQLQAQQQAQQQRLLRLRQMQQIEQRRRLEQMRGGFPGAPQ